MTATISDKIMAASSGTRPNPTTLTAQKSVGASILNADDLTGWATSTPVTFVLYKVDTSGNEIIGTRSDWKGIVSGNTITQLTLTAGTDTIYPSGSPVIATATARWADDLTSAALVSINQNGTLKDNSVTNTVIADGAVSTSKIADSGVTSAKLAPTKSTDANGWTVYNYGTWKEYERKITLGALGNIPHDTQFTPSAFTNLSLPVGMTDLSNAFLSVHYAPQFAGGFLVEGVKNGGSGNNPVNNTALTFPIYNCLNFDASPGESTLYLKIKDA